MAKKKKKEIGINNLKQTTKEFAKRMSQALENKADREELSNIIAEEVIDDDTFEDFGKVTREELKKDLIKVWWKSLSKIYIFSDNKAEYNEETGFFELNGLTDITLEEALCIITMLKTGQSQQEKYAQTSIRTIFPFKTQWGGDYTRAFQNCQNLEVFIGGSPSVIAIGNGMFSGCSKLRKAVGINCYNTNTIIDVGGCINLEILEIQNIRCNQSFKDCILLNLSSFQYMISKAANTTTITFTVHPNIYNALLGIDTEYPFNGGSKEEWVQLLADATAKNISFATE